MKKVRDQILYGGNGKGFEGIIPNLRRRFDEATWTEQEDLDVYRSLRPCPECHGERLKPQSLAVKVKGRTISEYVNLPISEAYDVFNALDLSERENLIAGRVLKEIQDRLRFLYDVGVGYLTLGRSATTLSGGEGQRIRLATQIGANLTGVLYVLDEPSIGLHQRDNRALLGTLHHLRDLGNTIIVVEHDEETIRVADYLIDLGPGAGEHGGKVIFQGTPEELLKGARGEGQGVNALESLTGQYLRGEKMIAMPGGRRARGEDRARHPRRARKQPEEHRRAHPARRAGRRHRRERVGEVHARQRHPLSSRWRASCIAQATSPARTTPSKAFSTSTRSSRSISRRSGGRPARIPRPTPGCSRSFASCSRCCPKRRRAGSGRGGSRSTSKAGAAKAARATA